MKKLAILALGTVALAACGGSSKALSADAINNANGDERTIQGAFSLFDLDGVSGPMERMHRHRRLRRHRRRDAGQGRERRGRHHWRDHD